MKHNKYKKIVSIILAAAMITLLSAIPLTASAASPQVPGGATAINLSSGNFTIPNSGTYYLDAGSYINNITIASNQSPTLYLTGTISITHTTPIYIASGANLKLYLCDDADVAITATGNASAGINTHGNSLEISTPSFIGTGKLSATGHNSGAGIGGGDGVAGGTITINGGIITATGGGAGGAGIGGGGGVAGGTITINGGTIAAIGGGGGAGIGGGKNGGAGGDIVIKGGTITASRTGSNTAREIGHGSYGAAGTVTITGGSVYTPAGAVAPQPTNSTNPVYCNTLTVGNPAIADDIAITGLALDSTPSTYGLTDVTAMNGGKIYLWLPENNSSAASVQATAGGVQYSNTYPRGSAAISAVLFGSTTIGLDQSGTYTFGSVEAGYTNAPAAHTVTITNSGVQAVNNLAVALTGTNAADFTLGTLGTTTLAAAANTTVTVQPNTGLAAGTYTATVTVSGNNCVNKAFDVTFSINEAEPNASIDYVHENLAGLVPNASYTVNGTAYTADGSGELAIPSAWLNTTISIVKTNASSILNSTAQNLAIPPRPAIPAVTSVNESVAGLNDGEINNTAPNMEYSADGGTSWNSCTGTSITGLSAGNYLVREQATGASFAGNTATVVIATGAAPTYTLNVSQVTFATIKAGAAQPTPMNITIASSGNSAATIASVTVNGTAFTITGSGNTVPAGGSITSWTVQPTAALAAGTYSETITVTYDGGATATAIVAITVTSNSNNTTVSHNIAFNTNGGSAVASQSIKKGDKLTKPADPTREKYTFSGWYTDQACTKAYDFDKKVTGAFTLYAGWKWANPFTDVKTGDWFYSDVEYVHLNSLFEGTSKTTFSPGTAMDRSMVVTVLGRLSGDSIPQTDFDMPFTDVSVNHYAAPYIAWASEHGIVKGFTANTFGPYESLTREQIAEILYRYAVYKGIAPSEGMQEKLKYPDANSISSWAQNGAMYCQKHEIIKGNPDGSFNPQGKATRAEVAAILHRFVENVK